MLIIDHNNGDANSGTGGINRIGTGDLFVLPLECGGNGNGGPGSGDAPRTTCTTCGHPYHGGNCSMVCPDCPET